MMHRMLVVLSLCGWLTACTALMSQEPVRRSTMLALPPDIAYRRAVRAMAQLGGQVTTADATSGVLSATVHNAATLTVVVLPTAEGSTVEVTGTLLPNKVVVGRFTEPDDYVTLLHGN